MSGSKDTLFLGLTSEEVEARKQKGCANTIAETSHRTYGEILYANIFTLFNGTLATLLVVILLFGSITDALFGIVLVLNALIGIVQEIRAKWTLDALALLNVPTARALRDGQIHEIPAAETVVDDTLELSLGDQVAVDGTIVASDGLEIDESLLSGESLPITKNAGDAVYSGSFVVAGSGRFTVTRVGAETYAQKVAAEARKFTLTRSELMAGIDAFLRYVVCALIIAAPLLFLTQMHSYGSATGAVPGTVAGLVGMVPQGLVLLMSIAFAISVIVLGRRKALVQELPAIEGLARADIVCFDKTGTLTKSEVSFHSVERLEQDDYIEEVLRAFGAVPSGSSTSAALSAAFPADKGTDARTTVPFSSERKWSALQIDESTTWLLGAPEVLLQRSPNQKGALLQAAARTESGHRVLLLGRSAEAAAPHRLPNDVRAIALVLFEEQVRADARATVAFFGRQGVACKVISGDNPTTVAAVCARAGLTDIGEVVDGGAGFPTQIDELGEFMERHSVFGRIKPQQKRDMVKALQARGHVVAMVGDGVNDVLALKEAVLGVAMGNGAPATKAVAQIVLLDSAFSTLPAIMAEGRKVAANIERVANIFLTKTVYIAFLAVSVAILASPFPFLPRHLTLIDALTIGIPSFFLALAPNAQRYRPGFVKRVLRFAVPVGFAAAAAAVTAYALAGAQDSANAVQATTAAFLTILAFGFWVLIRLSRPLVLWRGALLGIMAILSAVVLAVPLARSFFALAVPNVAILAQTLGIVATTMVLLAILLAAIAD